MLQFKILNVVFAINNSELWIDEQKIEAKEATLHALQIFLTSKGRLVTKEDLLEKIWKDVYVSEASAFKQVQLVKKIFSAAGLPKDCLENIYGKGYKIKYDLEQIHEEFLKPEAVNHNNKTSVAKFSSLNPLWMILLLTGVLSLLIYHYAFKPEPKNYLSASEKVNITDLVNDDWQNGLVYVSSLLTEQKTQMSVKDLAFLYYKKGLCQYFLMDIQGSIVSYKKAMKYYQTFDYLELVAVMHININNSLSQLTGKPDGLKQQLAHIQQAIKIYEDIDNPIGIVDAKISLGLFFANNNQLNKAIEIYKQVIEYSQLHEDKVGEMLGLGNLAEVYILKNDIDQAIVLGQKTLHIALSMQENRYIAQAFSTLSALYHQKSLSAKAMEMIEQSIQYQISSNNYNGLPPKIMTFSAILVDNFQYQKALDILLLSLDYFEKVNDDDSKNLTLLYLGMNYARADDWLTAQAYFEKALRLSKEKNLQHKQPMMQAYLALSYSFNNVYIQAVEPAHKVFKSKNSSKRAKTIAALALSLAYSAMEKQEYAKNWADESKALLDSKWLFESKLSLEFELDNIKDQQSILLTQLQNSIDSVSSKILTRKESFKINEKVYASLVRFVSNKTNSL